MILLSNRHLPSPQAANITEFRLTREHGLVSGGLYDDLKYHADGTSYDMDGTCDSWLQRGPGATDYLLTASNYRVILEDKRLTPGVFLFRGETTTWKVSLSYPVGGSANTFFTSPLTRQVTFSRFGEFHLTAARRRDSYIRTVTLTDWGQGSEHVPTYYREARTAGVLITSGVTEVCAAKANGSEAIVGIIGLPAVSIASQPWNPNMQYIGFLRLTCTEVGGKPYASLALLYDRTTTMGTRTITQTVDSTKEEFCEYEMYIGTDTIVETLKDRILTVYYDDDVLKQVKFGFTSTDERSGEKTGNCGDEVKVATSYDQQTIVYDLNGQTETFRVRQEADHYDAGGALGNLRNVENTKYYLDDVLLHSFEDEYYVEAVVEIQRVGIAQAMLPACWQSGEYDTNYATITEGWWISYEWKTEAPAGFTGPIETVAVRALDCNSSINLGLRIDAFTFGNYGGADSFHLSFHRSNYVTTPVGRKAIGTSIGPGVPSASEYATWGDYGFHHCVAWNPVTNQVQVVAEAGFGSALEQRMVYWV